jgi:hypothetical protein
VGRALPEGLLLCAEGQPQVFHIAFIPAITVSSAHA